MGQRSEKYWGRYAHSYDEGVAYVVGQYLREAIIKRLLRERALGEVIEFGCGTGYFTKVIARNSKHVIASDISDGMVRMARAQLKDFRNVTIQKDDCERSSFPSGGFDTVFMANLINTIENPLKALKESHRILREGGLLLIISYTDYGTKWFEKMDLALRYFQKFGLPPLYYKNYSPNQLIRLSENADFKVEEIQIIGDKAKALYLRAKKK